MIEVPFARMSLGSAGTSGLLGIRQADGKIFRQEGIVVVFHGDRGAARQRNCATPLYNEHMGVPDRLKDRRRLPRTNTNQPNGVTRLRVCIDYFQIDAIQPTSSRIDGAKTQPGKQSENFDPSRCRS